MVTNVKAIVSITINCQNQKHKLHLFIYYTAARIAASRQLIVAKPVYNNVTLINSVATRQLSSLFQYKNTSNSLLLQPKIQAISHDITRNVTKYSIRKGKRKSVKAVLQRFYRLNWGIWIRTKCGKQKRLWKKSPPQKRRLRQHVFCNATQSRLLDKMAGCFWMRPKYFVDDPYEPYHTRPEFGLTYTKPKPYFPPEK